MPNRINEQQVDSRPASITACIIRKGRIMKGERDHEKGEFSSSLKADKRIGARNPVALWKRKTAVPVPETGCSR
jgi:hypothetical protein